MLLTDRVRSQGAILANTSGGPARTRFTLAHELGHFLMEWHEPTGETGFTCQDSDMRATGMAEQHIRQESEANRFAIELLAPRSLAAPHLSPDPDLADALSLAQALGISVEAAVRRMIELRREPLAAVWSHGGRIRYLFRERGFPWIPLGPGQPLPASSPAHDLCLAGLAAATPMETGTSAGWIDRRNMTLREQTRIGPSRYAVTLLWACGSEVPESAASIESEKQRF
jgi:hypothetical protein